MNKELCIKISYIDIILNHYCQQLHLFLFFIELLSSDLYSSNILDNLALSLIPITDLLTANILIHRF